MIIACYIILFACFTVYTYGFIDLNLRLTQNPLFLTIQKPLSDLVFHNMPVAGVLYALFMVFFFLLYLIVLRSASARAEIRRKWKVLFLAISVFALVSFPAFSYDIFNYMTTAKVLFTHRENPYIVMPIEIPNDPALLYTRAANKVALYGPTWLTLTAVPHWLGGGDPWRTIVSFKLVTVMFYLGLVWIIKKATSDDKQVLFFALNPLVLNEVLVGSHNDIVMIVLAIIGMRWIMTTGLLKKIAGYIFFIASVFVKGATVILIPLLFIKKPIEAINRYAYWLLFFVFLLAPIREELYPWYAVWFLAFAAFIPMKKTDPIHGFTIALSFGLELRHLPYVLTREYGGYSPVLRILLTVVPVILYVCWYAKTYGIKKIFSH